MVAAYLGLGHNSLRALLQGGARRNAQGIARRYEQHSRRLICCISPCALPAHLQVHITV